MAGLLDGSRDVPSLPGITLPAGGDLGTVVVLPPGGQVFYVRGTGGTTTVAGTVTEYSFDPPGLRERLNGDFNTAFRQCVAGRGDVVVGLPGHTETASAAAHWSAIKAGTKVIGLGGRTHAPTVTFNATGSNIAIAVDNVKISGMRFLGAGALASTTALTVTKNFTISGASFEFCDNEWNVAVDTDQLCTTGMSLAATSDDSTIAHNEIWGGTTGTVTAVLTTAGAVDRLKIKGNVIKACATASLLDLSNAALTENDIIGNIIQNKLDTTTAVITPHATSTGFVDANIFGTAAAGTAPASSGFSTYTTTYWFGINRAITVSGASALLSPAVDS